jgi:PKD repeat protein
MGAQDFIGYPLVGYKTLMTQFEDISTGSYDQWLWNFGDGTQSTERAPLHYYANPGFYTVTLSVSGESGTYEVSKARYVRVLSKYTYDSAPATETLAFLRGDGIVNQRSVGVEIKKVQV